MLHYCSPVFIKKSGTYIWIHKDESFDWNHPIALWGTPHGGGKLKPQPPGVSLKSFVEVKIVAEMSLHPFSRVFTFGIHTNTPGAAQ